MTPGLAAEENSLSHPRRTSLPGRLGVPVLHPHRVSARPLIHACHSLLIHLPAGTITPPPKLAASQRLPYKFFHGTVGICGLQPFFCLSKIQAELLQGLTGKGEVTTIRVRRFSNRLSLNTRHLPHLLTQLQDQPLRRLLTNPSDRCEYFCLSPSNRPLQ